MRFVMGTTRTAPKKTAPKSKTTKVKTAAELHEAARVVRRQGGDPSALLEQAREAERVEAAA